MIQNCTIAFKIHQYDLVPLNAGEVVHRTVGSDVKLKPRPVEATAILQSDDDHSPGVRSSVVPGM